MANTYKDIVITPYRGNANANPIITFSSGDSSANYDMNMIYYPLSNGSLSFEGTAGQLFSITNDLSNSIFSVNDVSGIPSIEVMANGHIELAPFGGNVTVGRTIDGTMGGGVRLDVFGSANATQYYANGVLVTAIANSYATTITNANLLLAYAQANAVGVASNTGTGTGANTFTRQNALVNAAVGAANNFAYTGNIIFTPGNVLIGTSVGSSVADTIKLNILGSANAQGWYDDGVLVQTIANSYATTITNANLIATYQWANGKFLANAAVGSANDFAYTGNIIFTPGNVLIGTSVGSSVAATIKLNINGAANAAGWYDRGTLVQAISNSYADTAAAGANAGTGAGANTFTRQNALVNAAVGAANNFAYTGNLFITTGNLLIGRTVSSTIAGLKLDVLGGVNASAVYVNGTAVPSAITVFDDSVNATKYFLFTDQTSGTLARANISSATGTLAINPSTGNVMINRSTSTVGKSVKLDVNGAVNASSILANGVILNPGGDFNTNIINGVGYAMTTSLAAAFTAPATANKRYIVRSIHVTNISTSDGTANGEFHGTNYANASFCATVPVPAGSSVELLKKPKVLYPSDFLRLRADAANELHAYISYEISDDTGYFGGDALASADATYADLHTATSASVIESVLLVNVNGTYDVKARVVWTDASNVIQGYLCFDMIIPADSTVELLDMPKALPNGHKIRIYGNIGGRLEAIIAGKAS